MSVLVEVDWAKLSQLVKRTARVAIAAGRKHEALAILREFEEFRRTQPLVTLLSCKCHVIISSICKSNRGNA